MKYVLSLLILLILPLAVNAQSIVFNGQVKDADSGELLAGVSVWDSLSNTGAITNSYGFFSLRVPDNNHSVRFSYVGYQPLYFTPQDDQPVVINLKSNPELEEIQIISEREVNLPGKPVSLDIQKIKTMPMLLGEADVLKAFSFTPGVSTGNEGSAGLYIRGGTPDQNLILLDDVPVYNAMHLGGFFSVFNPYSLKKADLYKESFPARYGGRLSSVIDLSMKEGNNQEFGGEASVGLLNQSLALEGPIVKNKASFIVSGRISTLGITGLIQPSSYHESGEKYVYNFYDFNAKVNYQINKTDQIFLSYYNGHDRFRYDEWQNRADGNNNLINVGNNWGNNTATLRYNKMINSKLFAKAILIKSDYDSQFVNNFEDTSIKWHRVSDTKVRDLGAKLQLDYYPVNWLETRIGYELTRHLFTPFEMNSTYNDEPLIERDKVDYKSFESSLFLDSDLKLKYNLSVNLGARMSNYKVPDNNYLNFEPRAGVSWIFAKNWRATTGYTVMNQYLHLLVNNSYGFGYDAWVPATSEVPPARAIQWNIGVSRKLAKPDIDLSLSLYQKRLSNLIDYPDGANFAGMIADSWYNMVEKDGIGKNKGLEVMGSKNSGRLNGTVSYTLSCSDLKFDQINQGNWYPMKYDRTHNFNFFLNYELSKKWSFNTTFIYQTGHAVTLPVAAVYYNDREHEYPKYIYKERNNARMPAFHKLDFGFVKNGKFLNRYDSKLNLGVYNAYNRANPLYISVSRKVNHQTGEIISLNFKQYSMFPLLPFINYTVKF